MSQNSYLQKRHLILNIINHLGPISRTELIDLTDYRPASVSDIIKELLAEEIIIETGYASTGYGRKRAMLEMNRGHLCAIGISFSADSVIYIVSQIDGSILHQDTIAMDPQVPKEAWIQDMTAHVGRLLKLFSDKEMIGIGISNPTYDPTSYQPTSTLMNNYTHFHDWIDLNLKPRLESCFKLPVENYSCIAMPAMAEQQFGVAKGAKDFICVELSNGIGASIFCNGRPVIGSNGRAAELGHMVIDYSNASNSLCYCGKPGCVEKDTAYPALVSKINTALKQGVFSVLNSDPDCAKGITVQAIRRALQEGDKLCMHYVKEIAIRLGVAISNVVNLLNPELVVLNGFMLELGDYFLQHLEVSIRENTLSLANDFEIRISDSNKAIYSLGAVAEIFSSYLKQDNYKWVYETQANFMEAGELL